MTEYYKLLNIMIMEKMRYDFGFAQTIIRKKQQKQELVTAFNARLSNLVLL